MWCRVIVFGSIRVRAVKCTIERLGGVREREREFGAVCEFLDACDWEFSSAKVSGEGTGFRVEEVYKREFGVMWELLEAYDWEFSSARASCDCKIESFRGEWFWAQMLSLNAKLSILQRCDFQYHTSKAPGMCAYYIAGGTPWLWTLFQQRGGGIHPSSRFFSRHRRKYQSINSILSDF